MANCWNDGLAGLATERGIDEMEGLMVDLMDGEVSG